MPRYQKAPKDPRGGHTRLYHDIQDSPAWRALSWFDQGLYFAMRRKFVGSNNGNIEATIKTLSHHDIRSDSSLSKGLRALRAVGLIDMTRQGGIAAGNRAICCLYRFTDESVLEQPKIGVKKSAPTNDWRRFERIVEAKAAVDAAHSEAKRPNHRNSKAAKAKAALEAAAIAAKKSDGENTSKIRKSNRPDSEIEGVQPISDSISESDRVAPASICECGPSDENPAPARVEACPALSRCMLSGPDVPASRIEHLYTIATHYALPQRSARSRQGSMLARRVVIGDRAVRECLRLFVPADPGARCSQ